MSSTFLNISKKKNIQSFKARLHHNLRKKNLNTGKYVNQEFINIIKIDRKNELNDLLKVDKVDTPNLTKSDLSRKIAKQNQNLKKAKTQKTKDKILLKINDLKEQRDNTKALSKAPKTNQFFELDMSITSVKKELLRDKNYAEDFLNVYQEWFQNKFKTAEIIGLVAHLDQGNPHTHLNFIYNNDNNITKDLESSFTKKSRNYLEMQKDFNNFVKNHNLIKKYNIEINEIGANGKRNYIPASKYKLMQDRAKQQATKLVNNYVSKEFDNNTNIINLTNKDKIIDNLKNALINTKKQQIELNNAPKFFKNLENENEKFEKENLKLKEKIIKFENENNKFNEYEENNKLKIVEIKKIVNDVKENNQNLKNEILTKDEIIENLENKNKSLNFKLQNKNRDLKDREI